MKLAVVVLIYQPQADISKHFIMFNIVSGTIGFFACFLFVLKLYGSRQVKFGVLINSTSDDEIWDEESCDDSLKAKEAATKGEA